jgi:hypothetical protein
MYSSIIMHALFLLYLYFLNDLENTIVCIVNIEFSSFSFF